MLLGKIKTANVLRICFFKSFFGYHDIMIQTFNKNRPRKKGLLVVREMKYGFLVPYKIIKIFKVKNFCTLYIVHFFSFVHCFMKAVLLKLIRSRKNVC